MRHKIFIFTVIVLTAFTLTILQAQSKKEIKEKLSKLKGEIEKIVISTDEGEVTFEGEEAKEISERLTNFYSEKDWVFEMKRDGDKEKIYVVKRGDSDSNFNWVTTDGDSISEMIFIEKIDKASKELDIKIENGNKKVTVTKVDENGEQTIETYEGEAAEEYLKKLEEDGDIKILQLDHLGGEKEKVRVIIEKLKKEKE